MCPVTFATFVRRLGHRRWFSQVGRVMVPVDRLLSRLTRGRLVALRMPGLPCMLITTTGRRSGQPRITPLLYARDGDAFVVVASNWGQRHHPAWSTNLLADPAASVTVGGRSRYARYRSPVPSGIGSGN
jgi:deazaflavin-dependent oxidoreductase (nitroreductase family)